MRCAVYARLSKDRRGLSENVEIQIQECVAYAQAMGWIIVGVFQDNDISASRFSTAPRPGYQALLDSIQAGEVDVVLATEMQRIYRRLEELLEVIYLAETTPLRKIETTNGNGYDLSTGVGIHNAVAAVNNAVLESRQISDRIRRKKRAQAKEGLHNGGPRPYGFEADGLTVRESEAEVLRDAATRLLVGESLRSITRRLNNWGITTANGKQWHMSTLRDALASPRVKGVRINNGVEYPAAWPAIIDPETWESLQLLFRSESRLAKHPKAGRSYLLTGFIECGECHKRTVVGNSTGRHDQQRRRYYCVKTNEQGVDTGCGQCSRRAEPLELLVTQAVLDVLDSEQMGQVLAAASESDEMKNLVRQYEDQKAKKGDALRLWQEGKFSEEDMLLTKELAEQAMEDTKRKMERIKSGMIFASLGPGETIRDAWDKHDLYWRRSLIAMLIEKIIIHKSRPGTMTWQPEGSDRAWRFDPSKVEIVWREKRLTQPVT
jgi:DNA invertase Pin-like site-specific DNA recombinase